MGYHVLTNFSILILYTQTKSTESASKTQPTEQQLWYSRDEAQRSPTTVHLALHHFRILLWDETKQVSKLRTSHKTLKQKVSIARLTRGTAAK